MAVTLPSNGREKAVTAREHSLAPNFRRMLGWVVIAAAFWLSGAFMEGPWRIGLWLVAVLCEYVSPMFGFALPGLGRSHIGTLTMWLLYFGTTRKDAIHCITGSSDPGRTGAYFHYVHAILVAGIIAMAVGNDLVMAHPDERMTTAYVATLILGPVIFLFASLLYKREVYRVIAKSHLVGIVLLLALAPDCCIGRRARFH